MNTENKTPAGAKRGQPGIQPNETDLSIQIIAQIQTLLQIVLITDPLQVWLRKRLGDADYDFRIPNDFKFKAYLHSAEWIYIDNKPLSYLLRDLLIQAWDDNLHPEPFEIINAVYIRAVYQQMIYCEWGLE